MANRTFKDKSYCLVNREVRLYCAVSVGGGGAVTLQKWNYPALQPVAGVSRSYTAASTGAAALGWPQQQAVGSEGIRSVARTGTGLWTVTFQDDYQRCLFVGFSQVLAGGLGNIVAVAQNSTLTNLYAVGGGTLGLALMSSTATAADPTSGSTVLLTFILQDASEP